ncbi:cellulase CelA1 [Mycobacterium tuberculosis T92]|uniref:glycoside hydrolase family 6 protein n=1 Tax=Mycobacterium tuberculosis complex TaxID=77643 RepID=UPI00045B219E|nr:MULTISPECIES: glycoside hydrolase family 6 protein [Mycobacterium tuberculosis complex]KBF37886.1 cellulase CelA1 [Mycobacterium tuberculosis T92]WJH94424.1 1,4-beta-glucanase [Mycobacterium tuberculosis complex sp. N0157]
MTRRTGQRWRGTLPGRRPWTRPAPATCRRHLAFVELRDYFARVMSSAIGSAARWIVPLLGVAAVASIGVIADPVRVVRAPALILVDAANPLAGKPFYVDPASAAMVAARNANPPNAELTSVANTPQSYWLDQAFPPATVGGTVARYTGAAQAAGAMPVLTLYGIPHRDCGSYASGGFATGTDYRGWIDAVASGLGSSPATIIVEPDALAMADCLSPDQRQERFDLVRYAVDTLTRDPAAAVYVDAGHSRWLSAEAMAARLNDVGVGRARGFSLNVSNFYTTDEEIGYGEAISGLTNGSHYVIDTSRNGAGPAPDAPLNWCNPSGRALGAPPTTATAGAHADAYLWIKRPGESDGTCGRGEPQAGRFVSQYAIDLAHNAGQ